MDKEYLIELREKFLNENKNDFFYIKDKVYPGTSLWEEVGLLGDIKGKLKLNTIKKKIRHPEIATDDLLNLFAEAIKDKKDKNYDKITISFDLRIFIEKGIINKKQKNNEHILKSDILDDIIKIESPYIEIYNGEEKIEYREQFSKNFQWNRIVSLSKLKNKLIEQGFEIEFPELEQCIECINKEPFDYQPQNVYIENYTVPKNYFNYPQIQVTLNLPKTKQKRPTL